MVQPIPDEYRHVLAYIAPRDAAAAIAFYVRAFGARERMRMPGPNGRIGHAELLLRDDLLLMLADEPSEALPGYRAPSEDGATTFAFTIFVEDVDAICAQAVEAGATLLREPTTEFYGDREGRVLDPFGYVWSFMTHVEDVSDEEMRKRAAERAGTQ